MKKNANGIKCTILANKQFYFEIYLFKLRSDCFYTLIYLSYFVNLLIYFYFSRSYPERHVLAGPGIVFGADQQHAFLTGRLGMAGKCQKKRKNK